MTVNIKTLSFIDQSLSDSEMNPDVTQLMINLVIK